MVPRLSSAARHPHDLLRRFQARLILALMGDLEIDELRQSSFPTLAIGLFVVYAALLLLLLLNVIIGAIVSGAYARLLVEQRQREHGPDSNRPCQPPCPTAELLSGGQTIATSEATLVSTRTIFGSRARSPQLRPFARRLGIAPRGLYSQFGTPLARPAAEAPSTRALLRRP